MKKRVVITGCGTINPLGNNVLDTCNTLLLCKDVIQQKRYNISGVETLFNVKEVQHYDPAQCFLSKELLLLERMSQYTLIAAKEAVNDAGLVFSSEKIKHDTAIILGCGTGGEHTHEEELKRLYCSESRRVSPLTIIKSMISAPASNVGIYFGITGPTYNISSACSSSANAIVNAFQLVQNGVVRYAITGGTEACLTYGILKAWEAMGILSKTRCSPFCSERDGIILGEGSTLFVLEDYESAIERNANIYAEIKGFGISSDAYNLTKPSLDGQIHAIESALENSGINITDVDYINAHGTGTKLNDVTETNAIKNVFMNHSKKIPISSTKAIHGHLLGASGAIELLVCILSLRDNIVLPTINLTSADPECDLDYVPNIPRKKNLRTILSNSFAFGGLNTVLAIKRMMVN